MTTKQAQASRFMNYSTFVGVLIGVTFSVLGSSQYVSSTYTTKDESKQIHHEMELRYTERNEQIQKSMTNLEAEIVDVSTNIKNMDCKYDAILDVLVLHSTLPIEQKNKILDLKSKSVR